LWYLKSDKPMIEWTETAELIWGGYLRTNQRWTYRGYYDVSPSSYEPYSAHMYWRSPGCHLPVALTRTGGSVMSDQLAYMMLDVTCDWQAPGGYWPSEPKSQMLMNEAGIGAGFYDTRFNNELAEALLIAGDKHKEPKFTAAALAAADWLVTYAAENHFEVTDNGYTGWLVYDYTWPGHDAGPTRSSLNHQLQEIYTLLLAFAADGNGAYAQTADKLLDGVRAIGDAWLREDGRGLEYGYMPDGTLGLEDYEYLTYNDMIRVQGMLEALGRERDALLDRLIDAKKAQMDRENITGYTKWVHKPYFPRPAE